MCVWGGEGGKGGLCRHRRCKCQGIFLKKRSRSRARKMSGETGRAIGGGVCARARQITRSIPIPFNNVYSWFFFFFLQITTGDKELSVGLVIQQHKAIHCKMKSSTVIDVDTKDSCTGRGSDRGLGRGVTIERLRIGLLINRQLYYNDSDLNEMSLFSIALWFFSSCLRYTFNFKPKCSLKCNVNNDWKRQCASAALALFKVYWSFYCQL